MPQQVSLKNRLPEPERKSKTLYVLEREGKKSAKLTVVGFGNYEGIPYKKLSDGKTIKPEHWGEVQKQVIENVQFTLKEAMLAGAWEDSFRDNGVNGDVQQRRAQAMLDAVSDVQNSLALARALALDLCAAANIRHKSREGKRRWRTAQTRTK